MKMKRNLVRLSMVCLLAAGIAAFASPSVPAQAATVKQVTAYCSAATVSGSVTKYAPYVRITVALASDLNKTIARVYARVGPDRSYSKRFSYSAQQPDGTNLIFAICESDGKKCLRQAALVSASCQPQGAPTPTPVPTLPPTATPVKPPTMVPPTPTPIEPPTMVPPTPTPIEPPTMVPPTPTPIEPPTMVPTLPPTPTPVLAFCTAPTTIEATCSWTRVSGCITMAAPWVRVMAYTGSYPITQIGEAVGSVQQDGSYSVIVSYPSQQQGSHLIFSYGEWDGSWWLHPATITGMNCSG